MTEKQNTELGIQCDINYFNAHRPMYTVIYPGVS
jgi:hypothetical protein